MHEGSPSSSPLEKPSQSLSFSQSAFVHFDPSDLKSIPNWFRESLPPALLCPTPGHAVPDGSLTLSPFGILSMKKTEIEVEKWSLQGMQHAGS